MKIPHVSQRTGKTNINVEKYSANIAKSGRPQKPMHRKITAFNN